MFLLFHIHHQCVLLKYLFYWNTPTQLYTESCPLFGSSFNSVYQKRVIISGFHSTLPKTKLSVTLGVTKGELTPFVLLVFNQWRRVFSYLSSRYEWIECGNNMTWVFAFTHPVVCVCVWGLRKVRRLAISYFRLLLILDLDVKCKM